MVAIDTVQGGAGRHVGQGAVGTEEVELAFGIKVHPQLRKHQPGELIGFSRVLRVVMGGFPDNPKTIGIGRAVGVDLLVELTDLLVERFENQRHFDRRDLQRLGKVDGLVGMFGVVTLAVDVAGFVQNGGADRKHCSGCGQDGFLCHERTSSFVCLFGPIPPKARLY